MNKQSRLKYRQIFVNWTFWLVCLLITLLTIVTYSDVGFYNYALNSGEQDLMFCAETFPGLFITPSAQVILGVISARILLIYILFLFFYLVINVMRERKR